ncbi:Glutathione S-transferase [Lasiodiplodia theobromae]|uniref:Glutathione S-transferase n=1 Tax=Lasiodiplodia theobromae TaxID=45133 RepID=UPI0015C2C3B4|nr:Glutathione S-transferase [Lasiodiplodia theobromae]KAF4539269.1 Glutathione S-transferase [Lasiodiplodia theobromae]
MDSTPIASFLDSTYPTPPLLPYDPSIQSRARAAVGPAIRISIPPRELSILSPRSQEYFRRTREAALGGQRLEELLEKEEEVWKGAEEEMREVAKVLMARENEGLFGPMREWRPSQMDFWIAGAMQAARCKAPAPEVSKNDVYLLQRSSDNSLPVKVDPTADVPGGRQCDEISYKSTAPPPPYRPGATGSALPMLSGDGARAIDRNVRKTEEAAQDANGAQQQVVNVHDIKHARICIAPCTMESSPSATTTAASSTVTSFAYGSAVLATSQEDDEEVDTNSYGELWGLGQQLAAPEGVAKRLCRCGWRRGCACDWCVADGEWDSEEE